MTERCKQGPVERVLRKARRLIERGWTRGRYHVRRRGVDCYCADGAVGAAMGLPLGVPARGPAFGLLYREACATSGVALCSARNEVARFNDAQKTKRPVLALFDRAIARAKAEGL